MPDGYPSWEKKVSVNGLKLKVTEIAPGSLQSLGFMNVPWARATEKVSFPSQAYSTFVPSMELHFRSYVGKAEGR